MRPSCGRFLSFFSLLPFVETHTVDSSKIVFVFHDQPFNDKQLKRFSRRYEPLNQLIYRFLSYDAILVCLP